MKNNRTLSLVGLATKAGKTVSGEFSTEKSVKTGKGLLVLAAEDASENTKKKFKNMCTFYQVPIYFFSDKESLGRAMGKDFRACLAVQDENFAEAIRKTLEDNGRQTLTEIGSEGGNMDGKGESTRACTGDRQAKQRSDTGFKGRGPGRKKPYEHR